MFEFRTMAEDDQETVLRWRTRPEVTRYMFTDPEPDLERQLSWYREVVVRSADSRHWIVQHCGRPIGVISLTDIDRRSRRCSYGYYVGEPEARALGGLIPPYLYNYAFFDSTLGIETIRAEVFAENRPAVRLHRLFHFRQLPEASRPVLKGETPFEVLVFELDRSTWGEKGGSFLRYRAEFGRANGA